MGIWAYSFFLRNLLSLAKLAVSILHVCLTSKKSRGGVGEKWQCVSVQVCNCGPMRACAVCEQTASYVSSLFSRCLIQTSVVRLCALHSITTTSAWKPLPSHFLVLVHHQQPTHSLSKALMQWTRTFLYCGVAKVVFWDKSGGSFMPSQ